MSDNIQYNNQSVANVFFTEPASTVYDKDQDVAVHTARIVTQINTIDPNAQVVTTEQTLQPKIGINGNDATAFITTIVTTTDTSVVITTTPVVSSGEITVETVGREETTSDGMFVTTLICTVVKTGDPLDVYVSTVVTTPTANTIVEPTYRYIILRHDLIDGHLHGVPGGDYNMTCQEMYSLMNFACVKMSEGLYHTLLQGWSKEKIIEIDEDTAFYGTTFFSEIRPVAKLWEAKTTWYGEKVPTEITPEIVGYILTVMKAFATEIIHAEYERRYLVLRGASDFESDTWHIQGEEAAEFDINPAAKTPFIDYLAASRNMPKIRLVAKILEKRKKYHESMAMLLADMQTLLAKFNSCTTVWDINILYEDYFGIAMPISMAIKLGRTLSDTNWNRVPEWRVKGNGCYF
jgi:hypothetical protein